MLFKEDKVARAEHQAVRENAGWYRWTHDLVEVKGKDAEKFLDRLFVGAITRAGIGRTKYTTMLNEDGKIIDDTLMATCWTTS
jgi:aminomethyltransferase